MIEQQTDLDCFATSRLDNDRVRSDERRHLRRVRLHDLVLGARDVVLVEPGDLLEQARTGLIVEKLWRQRLRIRAKAGVNLPPKALLRFLRRLDVRPTRDGEWQS